MRRITRALALATLATALCATAAMAADIRVLTAGALKPVVQAAIPDFERQTGHRVILENGTAGALARRIQEGAVFDLAVLTQSTIAEVIRTGQIAAASSTPVSRVGIGFAVKQGAPVPDISSTEKFRQALLDARSIAHIDPAAGGSSGIYLVKLFEQWGIAERIKAKAILVPGGLTAERVVSGEADVAVQQMSELVVVPGVKVVGPLPAEIQNYTLYVAGISSRAAQPAAAQQLLTLLQSPGVQATFEARGMLAP
ncbi:MAG: substrate-binding domain-containing protein [Burkholderiales bacterium]|nr:substrate-binding domain-containing protein [Burkholderiales bacterium]